jgi:hypothetical protein
MKNFGVYWDSNCTPLTGLSDDLCEYMMKNMISNGINKLQQPDDYLLLVPRYPIDKKDQKDIISSSSSSSLSSNHSNISYIIETPNEVSVKIIHRDNFQEHTPKVDVVVDSSDLVVKYDKSQYDQLITTESVFNLLNRQKQLAILRPLERPTEDPKAWWKYAYNLVTGRNVKRENKMQSISYCIQSKSRYTKLAKRSRASEDSNFDILNAIPLTPSKLYKFIFFYFINYFIII